MPKRSFIREWQPNQIVEGVYTIQNAQLGMTKGGKPYLKCLLVDRTGRAPGRMWNTTEDLFQSIPTDGFVHLEGQTQPYQGEMQLIIQRIESARPTADELLDLLPSTEHDIEQMFGEVRRLLGTMKSASLRRLAEVYLADAPLMDKFRRAPAAMQLHHAFLGGLLEHTWSLMRLAEAVLPLYPRINRDLVLMGLFLHDLGKCHELTWEAGFGYSDDGQLVGHVARGVIWLESKARACAEQGQPMPDELLRVLHHIILSHHGQPEFGALKIPATPEAILVNLLDNLDAKTHMALAARDESRNGDQLGGNFTEKVWALGTRIYRPDVMEGESPAPLGPVSPAPNASRAVAPHAPPARPAAPKASAPAKDQPLDQKALQGLFKPSNLKGGIG
jgi:3'-5' exoribonuclease